MSKNGKVRVAIIGVVNCASSLVQGVEFYRNAADDAEMPGLMQVDSSSKCDSIVSKEYLIRGLEIKAFPWA